MVKVGVDLEPIARFDFVRTRGGAAFYRRVFTPKERAALGRDPVTTALYFTVKEAVAKVLGTGLALDSRDGVAGSEIEVSTVDGQDAPTVQLRGRAAEVAAELKLSSVKLLCTRGRTTICSLAVAAQDPRALTRVAAAARPASAEIRRCLLACEAAAAGRDGVDDELEGR